MATSVTADQAPDAEWASRSWRPDFARLWTAETISAFGGEITGVALPLTAVALLDASAFQMGMLAAASTLPNLLFAFYFGVLADRVSQRWSLLVWSNLLRMGLFAVVLVAWLGGFLSTNLLIVIAFAAGSASVCFRIAWSSYLPSIVPPENLVEANSKLRTSMTVAGLTGVGLAGVLVQLFGGPVAVTVNAVGFAVSTGFLVAIQQRERRDIEQGRSRRKLLPDVAEGLRYIGAEPRMRAIAGAAANLNLFSSIVLAPVCAVCEPRAGHRTKPDRPAVPGVGHWCGRRGSAGCADRQAIHRGAHDHWVVDDLLGGAVRIPGRWIRPHVAGGDGARAGRAGIRRRCSCSTCIRPRCASSPPRTRYKGGRPRR